MGHSHLSKVIGQLAPVGRAGLCDHVTESGRDDWLFRRGLATEEGAFPRGLRGRGGTKRGWAQRVMAAPWPRVHLYRSLGPVTKESRRRRNPLSRVGPGAGESQCRSPAAPLREAPGDAGRGEVRGLGTSVRVGKSRPSLRRGDRTGAEGGSWQGPRRGGRGQSSGNSPEVLHRGPR